MIDFTWKMIQVKMAFMVRNLSFKVKNDFKDKDIKTAATISNSNAVYEKKIVKLERTIVDQSEQLNEQKIRIENLEQRIARCNSELREAKVELDIVRNPPGFN